MSLYIVDIHGDIEGDYEIVKKYEEPKTDILDKIRAEEKEDCISSARLLEHLENITMDTNPDHYECKDDWYQANGFNACKVDIEIFVKTLTSEKSITGGECLPNITCYSKNCVWNENDKCQCDNIELGNHAECLMWSEENDDDT